MEVCMKELYDTQKCDHCYIDMRQLMYIDASSMITLEVNSIME